MEDTRRRKTSFLFKTKHFSHSPLAGGTLLILCTLVAIILSNLDATASWYQHLWHTTLTIGFEGFNISKPVEMWINDGLMAVFFFVIGLEIKREILAGQLSTPKQAMFPVVAAIGGMVVPALIYIFFNSGTAAESGWGIPMATDIAFALGILSLMGSRVPVSLKIFLTALAIVDDLGAILVIAIFYSGGVNWLMLLFAILIFAYLVILNRRNVHKMRYYLIPSIILWVLFLHSGVHATIAGVLIAMTMPIKSKFSKHAFVCTSQHLVEAFRRFDKPDVPVLHNHGQHLALQSLRVIARNTISPIQRLEYALHPSVNFFIMPMFALANAGISLSAVNAQDFAGGQGLGIIFGLVVGKPVGILIFSALAIRLGLAAMPKGASWHKMTGVACLGGIGFTMSIFINSLAFTDPQMIAYGKVSILIASIIAAVLGCMILQYSKPVDFPK